MKCMRCKTGINSATFHCECGDMATYDCHGCSRVRVLSVASAPICDNCHTSMIERGYRPAPPPEEDPFYGTAEYGIAFLRNHNFDYLIEHESVEFRGMLLTLQQQRRLDYYDHLIERIDRRAAEAEIYGKKGAMTRPAKAPERPAWTLNA